MRLLIGLLLAIIVCETQAFASAESVDPNEENNCPSLFEGFDPTKTLELNGISLEDFRKLETGNSLVFQTLVYLPLLSHLFAKADPSFFEMLALGEPGIPAEIWDQGVEGGFYPNPPLLNLLPADQKEAWKSAAARFFSTENIVIDPEVPMTSRFLEAHEGLFFTFIDLLKNLPKMSPLGMEKEWGALDRYTKRRPASLTFHSLLEHSRGAQMYFLKYIFRSEPYSNFYNDMQIQLQNQLLGRQANVPIQLTDTVEHLNNVLKIGIADKDPSLMKRLIGAALMTQIESIVGSRASCKSFREILITANAAIDRDTFINRGFKPFFLSPTLEILTKQGIPTGKHVRAHLLKEIEERYKITRRLLSKLRKQEQKSSLPKGLAVSSQDTSPGIPLTEKITGLGYRLREKQKNVPISVASSPVAQKPQLVTIESLLDSPNLLDTIKAGQPIAVIYKRTGMPGKVAFSQAVLDAFRRTGKGASPAYLPKHWLQAIALGPGRAQGQAGIKKLIRRHGLYDWEVKVIQWPDRLLGYLDGSGCFQFEVFDLLEGH